MKHQKDSEAEMMREMMLEVVENQLRGNNPPETKQTLQRLVSEGFSETDAKELIARVISDEMFQVLNEKKAFNQKRYVNNLKNLPKLPWE